MNQKRYLIVGNGAAGLSAAEAIRSRDTQGQITIVSDEPYRFYSRPGIAYYLSGQLPAEQLIARGESFYQEHNIHLQYDKVTSLEISGKQAILENGGLVDYDVILIATGASAVKTRMPGSELKGVFTFDTLEDTENIISYSRKSNRAIAIGGGITALELAEGLQHRGVETYLLQRGERIWPRLFDDHEARIVEDAILKSGVKLLYNEEIAEILGKKGKVTGVRLKSGGKLRCQIVGVAIGVRPNLELTIGNSLEKDQGLLVNQHMQTNLPTVFAAGDVAQVLDRWTKKHNLDVLWPSAIREGRAAGYNMVDVAHGHSPRFSYQKGSPFNAALLFGVHMTAIGQLGDRNRSAGEDVSYLSRGSSNVWTFPFSGSYRSAWDKKGINSIRVVLVGDKIVGALILGDQRLADPIRDLIEHEVVFLNEQSSAPSGSSELPERLEAVWHRWKNGEV